MYANIKQTNVMHFLKGSNFRCSYRRVFNVAKVCCCRLNFKHTQSFRKQSTINHPFRFVELKFKRKPFQHLFCVMFLWQPRLYFYFIILFYLFIFCEREIKSFTNHSFVNRKLKDEIDKQEENKKIPKRMKKEQSK